ncbi:hypothetical protein VPH234P9_0056 [Vibrio phage 234P9]|nr:hypothetical protein PODOV077v1_p0006 [Vibrio phage 5P1a]
MKKLSKGVKVFLALNLAALVIVSASLYHVI